MNDFNFPNWYILAVEETDYEHLIRVEYAVRPTRCSHCGSVSEHTRFGKRQQRFRDLPVQGKPTNIFVQRRRCRCKNCGRTFLEWLPDIDEHHRATKRLVAYIRRELPLRTYVSIAAEVGLSEGSIRNISRDSLRTTSTDVATEVAVPKEAHLFRVGEQEHD